jgi:hypothetical protein
MRRPDDVDDRGHDVGQVARRVAQRVPICSRAMPWGQCAISGVEMPSSWIQCL